MGTMTVDDILGAGRNFASLSTKDLLEARDTYHWHLIHKANVVATAIGLYRIRKTDSWPDRKSPSVEQTRNARAAKAKPERTFENSEVRDYSWPCVLVFVDKWQRPEDFASGGTLAPDQAVPKTLYMPDGRMIPVCRLVDPEHPRSPASPRLAVAEGPDRWRLSDRQRDTGRVAHRECRVPGDRRVQRVRPHEPARRRPGRA